jgi:hypothetical protein
MQAPRGPAGASGPITAPPPRGLAGRLRLLSASRPSPPAQVLSVQTALSIQSHPDKELAERLHRENPEVGARASGPQPGGQAAQRKAAAAAAAALLQPPRQRAARSR